MIKTSFNDILWNYLGYFFNLGINIVLLPLMLHFLSIEEMALWYVFVSMSLFSSLLDLSFSPQLTRVITFSFSGVGKVPKVGIGNVVDAIQRDRYVFIAYMACRFIYATMALLAFVFLLSVGTYYILSITNNLPRHYVVIVWIIFSLAICINLYFNYYNAVVRGVGKFEDINKASILSKFSQILLCVVMLISGYHLYAVVLSLFFSVIVYRLYYVLKISAPVLLNIENVKFKWNRDFLEIKKLLISIWHNVWREGTIAISRYLNSQGIVLLSSVYLGTKITASMGMHLQILTIISALSGIFFNSMYPKITEARVNKDHASLLKYMSTSWVFFVLCFSFLFINYCIFGIPILVFFKPEINMPYTYIFLLGLYIFLESNHSLFASYLSTANTLPYVKAFVISSLSMIIIIYILLKIEEKSFITLILPMILVQLLYNNWKWPLYSLDQLQVGITGFVKQGFLHLQNIKKYGK